MVLDASKSSERGFTLVEVVIATVLLGILAIGVAQLFAVGTMANLRAKSQTSLSMLAVQKMEQLKALQWGFDQQPGSSGLPVSDLVTDLSECRWTSSVEHCASQPTGLAGTAQGLNPSPDAALTENTAGYVDYLDRDGNWVGNGVDPPPTTHYVRRWAIEPLPTNPNNTLVFQVLVTTLDGSRADAAGAGTAGRQEARLVSVKTRKAA